MTSRHLEFWFDFASPYSYLTALRIDELGAAAGVAIVWRPFLLGPTFKAQGWDTSPFNVYPAKGRYMVRDITRIAAARGHAFQMPLTFPANGLAAARIALVGGTGDWRAAILARGFQRPVRARRRHLGQHRADRHSARPQFRCWRCSRTIYQRANQGPPAPTDGACQYTRNFWRTCIHHARPGNVLGR